MKNTHTKRCKCGKQTLMTKTEKHRIFQCFKCGRWTYTTIKEPVSPTDKALAF